MVTKFLRGLHKYLGIPLSVFFVIWFLSGIVMVFAPGFPSVPATDPAATTLRGDGQPVDSLVRLALSCEATPTAIKIEGREGRDLITIKSADTSVVLDASTGLVPITAEKTPDEIAKSYCNAPILRVDTLSKVDQWIPFEYYEDWMPVYKYYFNDAEEHQLYITPGGYLLQMTNRTQRIKAWFGTIPHWLYFTVLRKHQQAWIDTVSWAALLGCVMCLAGIVIALIDWWHHARRVAIFSLPFRKTLWRWHFILGLLFGWCCITFAFSGYMSLAPLPDFLVKERAIAKSDSAGSAKRGERQMRPRRRNQNAMTDMDSYLLKPETVMASADSIRSIAFNSWEGHPYYTVVYPSSTRYIDATSATNLTDFVLTDELVRKRAERTLPEYQPKISRISEYDSEYYSRTGRMTPLPAIRVEYEGDELHTVEYYDPKGLGVRSYDDNSRLHNLLYGKLHRLSFKWLTDSTWLWYAVMLLLLAGGSALSITGFILTLQWLGRKLHLGRHKICDPNVNISY